MNDALITEAAERLGKRVPPARPIRSDIEVSFEFFPPATDVGRATLERVSRDLGAFDPSFVSVTYGAGGSSQERTFDAIAIAAASQGAAVAGHLTCVAASRADVQGVVDRYVDLGVRRIVALRGDAPADAAERGCNADGSHPDGYTSAAELVEALRARPDGDDLDISVAAYPEFHPKATSPAADLDNLKRKFDAGADRALTQFFFEADVFLRFLEHARTAGISGPIVPGIMPITDFAGVCRFADRCGTVVPEWMHDLFAGLDDAPEVRELVAATVAAEQCKRLAEHGVRQFHFYTMNKPNLVAATCRMLGLTPESATQSNAYVS